MATRTISTKLAITGESEYRQSLQRINGEIKVLQSELRLTNSQFQTNANSMAALTAKGDSLTKLYNAQKGKVQELQAALENAQRAEKIYADRKAELSAKIAENSRRLEELKNSTEDTSEEQAKLTAENRELAGQLEKCDAQLVATEKGVNSWQMQLNTAQVKLNDLDAELKLNGEYLEEARQSSDGCATSIDRFGNRMQESARKADNLRDALAAAGVIAALKMTADALEECTKSSIEFESAMTGVAKTTDMSSDELAAMGREIQALATKIPATTTEIAGVVEAAGQLGIAKEDLLSFASVMVNLGVATNLTSEEAASALAKLANIVGTSADKYENLGSVIVALGNNFATTEADIVSMATRLASTGSIVGLTEPQIMAIATALSSVGIEAEAGGSAISKLLKKFETMVATGSPKLQEFASVAGMSAEEFAEAWGQDAVSALGMFIDGLRNIDDSGGSAVATLDGLGITEVRLSNAILALASSNGILTRSVELADRAWVENSALANEAALRYGTTESKLQMLANAADNTKIAIGDKLTPAIGRMADVGVTAFSWMGKAVDDSTALVPMITATASTIGVLAAGIVGYTAVTKTAAAVSTMFTAAMEANPIFLAVTAVAALAAGITALAMTMDGATPYLYGVTEAAQEMSDTISSTKSAFEESESAAIASASVADRYIDRLEELEAAGLSTAESQREYHSILALLCETVPELASSIDLETNTINGGTSALRANTEAWRQNAVQQAYQSRLTDLYSKYADVMVEAEENSIHLTQAQNDLAAAQDEQAGIMARMSELWDEAQAKANENYEAYGDLAEGTDFLTQEYYDLQAALQESNEAIGSAEMAIASCQEAIEKDEEATAAAREEIEATEQAVQNLTESVEANTGATDANSESQAQAEQVIGSIEDRLDSLANAYSEAYDAAYKSIDGQVGLFDSFAATVSKDTDTVEEMMERWATQTENLAKYTENLKKAAEYGLDDGLVSSLSDGSTESAGYLATIIDKIEELGGTTEGMSSDAAAFVDDFNASFAKTEEAKESFANTVATIQTDLQTAIAEMEAEAAAVDFSGFTEAVNTSFASVGVDFKQIGVTAGNGLSEGISSSTAQASTSATKMATDSVNAVKTAFGSGTGSNFNKLGQGVSSDTAKGIDEKAPSVVTSVKKMSEDTKTNMTTGAKNSVESFGTEFGKIVGKTDSQITQMKSTIKSSTSPLPGTMYSVGQDTVNGMINGLNSRSGSLYWTMSNIVNNAISRARTAADTHSPSKKTQKIFEDVDEGMIVGAENKRQKVVDTIGDIVNDAMSIEVPTIDIPIIDDRMPTIQQADTSPTAANAGIGSIAEVVAMLSDSIKAFTNGAFVLDGKTFIGKWTPSIDHNLGVVQASKDRGNL